MNDPLYLDTLTDKNGYQYVNVPADPYQLTEMGFSWPEATTLHQQALTARQAKACAEKRRYLLRDATTKIAPLQDALELGIATEDEITALNAWKHYRVALNRLDTTTAEVTWPVAPG